MTEIIRIIDVLFEIYFIALIIYIFMSWIPGSRETAIGEFLGKITEPYLEPFRRFIPPLGMFDLSPIVAILVLQFAKIGLIQLLIMIF
ncbi:YggT family protein [Caldibacillus thermolactis]|uniref:YggT family protein n=1 Tax=Pallidibacillus thermolactis TaxID=251051 RepID=A0ABT2WBW8_9BACI|nr:YggT family protein [Pallidibacillus thermolactis]MCU9593164.1 YggT family protein [Pallidibacillus thermolactis]MCU9600072.1 YggT family protein [Pallidibacillus thermolactis subsp. kokeshiiformis]MED1672191.1 YggT family protein [Pallidibacillus thermolactis subsp. kokeshiiformis]